MLVPLSVIDNAVADMGITCGYLFALPPAFADERGTALLLSLLEAATEQVIAKWRLLQGQAIWQKEKGIWAIDVPDEPSRTSRPFAFTSSRVRRTYAKAAGLAASPRPLTTATSPCGFQPRHKLAIFRTADLPTTFSGYAKTGASFLAVQVTVFDDVVAVGITAPHGLFDATGLGWAIRGLRAELRNEVWEVPPLLPEGTNPLGAGLEQLKREDASTDPVDVRAAEHALAGWVSAGSLKNVACFLTNYVWEKTRHHDEPRHIFLSRTAVDALVERVKQEVSAQTDGKEWVSTGDVLTAWVLKAVHADEASSPTAAAVSPVFALRDLLSVPAYPHNAVAPYPFSPTPIPLAELSAIPLARLALTHRRSLEAARTKSFLRATLLKMEALSWSNGSQVPVMPARAWPWRLRRCRRGGVSRTGASEAALEKTTEEGPDEKSSALPTRPLPAHHWIVSNQMVSGMADLTLPASILVAPENSTSSGGGGGDSDAQAVSSLPVVDAPSSSATAAPSSSSSSSSSKGDVPSGGCKEEADLPLLGFYVRITAPIKDHQAIRFQVNQQGIFLEGSMRRRRWKALGRAVEQLERDYGRSAGRGRKLGTEKEKGGEAAEKR